MSSIYVNDGSTDETGAILEDYAARHPERISLLHTGGLGPGPARNAGVAEARGEYIFFIDDDATAPPGWISGMLGRRELHGCDVLCGGIEPFSMDTIVERYLHYRMMVPLGHEARRLRAVPTVNMLLPRALFLEVGGFRDEFLPVADDWELCYRLDQAGAIIFYDPAEAVVHRYRADRAAAEKRLAAMGATGVYVCRGRYRSTTAYTAYSLLRFLASPFWLPRHYPKDLYLFALRMEAIFCFSRLAAYARTLLGRPGLWPLDSPVAGLRIVARAKVLRANGFCSVGRSPKW